MSNNKKIENMITVTTIIRDTNYSFLSTTTREDGKVFIKKIEKGSTEYGNTCHNFHMANVEIKIGNKITE
jgi:hypothetical protein